MRRAALDLGAIEAVPSAAELDRQVHDIALDASGHPAAITQAIAALGPRGLLIQMGGELASMITATFPLEEYSQALAAAKSPDHIKIQVIA